MHIYIDYDSKVDVKLVLNASTINITASNVFCEANIFD